eukprot:774335_1
MQPEEFSRINHKQMITHLLHLLLLVVFGCYCIIGIHDVHHDAIHQVLNSLSMASYSKYQQCQHQLEQSNLLNEDLKQICKTQMTDLTREIAELKQVHQETFAKKQEPKVELRHDGTVRYKPSSLREVYSWEYFKKTCRNISWDWPRFFTFYIFGPPTFLGVAWMCAIMIAGFGLAIWSKLFGAPN